MPPRRRHRFTLLLCLAVLGGTLGLGTGTASAAADPRDDPAKGLRFTGLERATEGPCTGRFQIRAGAAAGPPRCTHGPDTAPEGIDVRVARGPVAATATATATDTVLRPDPVTAAACTGDGSTGPRVQLVYANITGKADRYATFAASFQTWAAALDSVFDRSAAETAGSRRVRFVHDAACTPVITRTTLSVAAGNDFQTTVDELRAKGFNRNDRKYLVWVDANVYCGIGEVYSDDQAGPSNNNNLYSLISRVDNGCWGTVGQSVEAHELMHNLGGVQVTAPNATPYNHCTDEGDRMCYPDGSGQPMVQKCASTHENTFDCNHDDYFSTAPPAGSYLATHWNVANSAWLSAAAVPGAPTGVIAVAGEGTATLTWTAPSADGGQPVAGYVVTPYVGATAQPAQTFASAAVTQTLTGLGEDTYTFRVAAVNSVGTGPQSAASPAVTPASGARFHPLPPARILDTREGNGAPLGKVGPGASIALQITGRGGVPASGVSAVVLNVTVTEPAAVGFLTAWPAGEAQPLASNLNFVAGQTVPNLVVVKVGAGGMVSVYNSAGTTHVIADVAGWYGASGAPEGSRYHPVAPARLLDTRTGLGALLAKLLPTGALDLVVTGRGGVPSTGVSAVALNVTVTDPAAGGFLTTWPTGTQLPLASSLNFGPGQTVANLAVVQLGADGKISFYNGGGAVNLVADVAGWYGPEGEATGARYHPVAPARVLDTRSANGAPLAPLAGGTALSLQVTGRGGVPATGVTAVILNVIALEPAAGGYLTVWPTGEPLPLASNLNFAARQTVPNLVVAKVGAGGKVSIYNGGGTAHLVADVAGWYGL